MPEINLKCSCGLVRGRTLAVDSRSGVRVVCCCDDCQNFAEYLGQGQNVLDDYGGTDIFQMPISHLKITSGVEQLACVRLSPKGLYRWYAKCCNTPIGNSLGAGVALIGVVHNFMDNASTREHDLGEIRGYIQTKFAKQDVPANKRGSSFSIICRSLSKLVTWKLRGLNKPSVFFNDEGVPIAKPVVVDE